VAVAVLVALVVAAVLAVAIAVAVVLLPLVLPALRPAVAPVAAPFAPVADGDPAPRDGHGEDGGSHCVPGSHRTDHAFRAGRG